jgi:oxaloacetate decarboxylase gamma subunit
MEQNIGNALSIMLVGMATVFLILWLVVVIGNLIIRVTNKYYPAVEPVKFQKGKTHDSDSTGKIAAIVAAVGIITNGEGHVTKITKV